MGSRIFSLFFAAAISLSHISGAVAQQAIGTAVSVDDTVTGNGSRRISTSSSIFMNERISADQTGLGHFEFNDGTKMVVGPGTNMVFDELVFNPDGSSFQKFVLETTSGAVRFISGGSPTESYEIRTPIGVLGIRGTAFDFNMIGGRFFLMLVDGSVNFCTNNGECEVVRRKCDFIVANANGRITPPGQPRNGIFGGSDMRRIFPFINDQSNIQPEFQLRVNTCSGGAAGGAPGGGDDGNFDRDLNGSDNSGDF